MEVQMVWIIGGPGSGKGTQSRKMVGKYGYRHIDPCALINKEVKLMGPDSRRFSSVLSGGLEVPLEDIFPLIDLELKLRGRGNGLVIDGYPGCIEDAVLLEASLGPPDIVIALDVEEKASLHRASLLHYESNRPSLGEYVAASQAVIEKYADITVKVDSSYEPDRVFEVIQFNIDCLEAYEKRLTQERRSSYFKSLTDTN